MLSSSRQGDDTVTLTSQYLRTVIVGDDPDFTRAACEWIESEPGLIVVATAGSGFAANVVVDVLRPNLVVIDVTTPGMDGVEATRRIKARPEPPAVVWITAHAAPDTARTAREAGADAVLSKREMSESAKCLLRAFRA